MVLLSCSLNISYLTWISMISKTFLFCNHMQYKLPIISALWKIASNLKICYTTFQFIWTCLYTHWKTNGRWKRHRSSVISRISFDYQQIFIRCKWTPTSLVELHGTIFNISNFCKRMRVALLMKVACVDMPCTTFWSYKFVRTT